jgi:hypothetical protein
MPGFIQSLEKPRFSPFSQVFSSGTEFVLPVFRGRLVTVAGA